MLAPQNYAYHLGYVVVLYTIGGRQNVSLARKYFAQSIELKPTNNARANIGLALVRCVVCFLSLFRR